MPDTEPKQHDAVEPNAAGRIVHDARGRAIWQPAVEFDTDDTLHRLLQTHQLALLEDACTDAAEGFDPYRHLAVSSRQGPTSRRRPDLRALSAQILAERAKNSSGT